MADVEGVLAQKLAWTARLDVPFTLLRVLLLEEADLLIGELPVSAGRKLLQGQPTLVLGAVSVRIQDVLHGLHGDRDPFELEVVREAVATPSGSVTIPG